MNTFKTNSKVNRVFGMQNCCRTPPFAWPINISFSSINNHDSFAFGAILSCIQISIHWVLVSVSVVLTYKTCNLPSQFREQVERILELRK
jgi:hypothetical protein